MAHQNVLVKHALLAVTATYYLDYHPSEQVERFAQRHHWFAVELLGRELNKAHTYTPGNEEIILATVTLLNQDDVSHDRKKIRSAHDAFQVINWEHRDTSKPPKWFLAIQTVKDVLRISDPAQAYRNPENVQSSHARLHLGAQLAEEDIFASVVAPLQKPSDRRAAEVPYNWLISGETKDNTEIRGLIGMCPKLLHSFAKITTFCQELQQVCGPKTCSGKTRPLSQAN